MTLSQFRDLSMAMAQAAQQPIAIPARPPAHSAAALMFPSTGRFPFGTVTLECLEI